MPQLGVAVHQGLGVFVVLGRPTLDEVRREGERRTGKTDQWRGAELRHRQLHGLRDVGDVLRGQLWNTVKVGVRPKRLRDHGSYPRDDVQIHPDRGQGHHDVAEEDRRVDPVPAHRLQRDLGDQLRHTA
jgi:hypothetical protein